MCVYGQVLHADRQLRLSLDKSSEPSGCHKLHHHGDAFLAPAMGPSSVSLLCRRRENSKSRDHPSSGYVTIAPVGNNSYASQTHKTGHSYDCYI